MATKTKGRGRPKPQQQCLAEVVSKKGSGRAVAQELKCSQQSVSAWARYVSLPRRGMQAKMKKRYGIPTPWPPLPT